MDDFSYRPRFPRDDNLQYDTSSDHEAKPFSSYFSLELIGALLSRYLFHSNRSDYQENLFRAYLLKTVTPLLRGAFYTLIVLVLVTWPTDYLFFNEIEVIESYFLWRSLALVYITAFIFLINNVQYVQKRIFCLTYLAVLIGAAFSGIIFGSIKDLREPWFYSIYALPLTTVYFNFKIIRRIYTTVILTAGFGFSYIAGGMLYNPSGLYLDYPYLNFVVAVTIFFVVFDIGLGHIIYHSIRADFFESRNLKMQEQRIRSLAYHDDLTGLYNRQKIEDRLKREIHRSDRYDQLLSVGLVDLDHFKRINDEFGHQMGDKVLTRVAKKLQDVTRVSDSVGRYGGEEFFLIFPQSTISKTKDLCLELKDQISNMKLVDEKDTRISLTCSIGVTEYRGDDDTPERLMERADRAMYKAKDKGRNAVAVLV